jgi:hypothetical protein
MSMGSYLIEACRRRGIMLQVVDGGIEIEFDRINPPHDLIEQLRLYKVDVIRVLRGEAVEEPRRDAWRPPVSTSGLDGGGRGGTELGRLFTGPRAI